MNLIGNKYLVCASAIQDDGDELEKYRVYNNDILVEWRIKDEIECLVNFLNKMFHKVQSVTLCKTENFLKNSIDKTNQ